MVPFFPFLKVANKTSNCSRYCEEGDMIWKAVNILDYNWENWKLEGLP